MKKIIIIAFLVSLIGCNEHPILTPKEYTITDTTYVSRNGFGYILSYDIILLNHYDSLYYSGELSRGGKLIRLNSRPIKLK